jgi:hypothetical protein
VGTRVHKELAYDAPLADVSAMLTDPAFREEVCKYMGVLRWDVSIDSDADATEVTIEQVQPAKGIPSFAKKFVGDEITIVQRETWRTPDEGSVHVTIPGKPGSMDGSARLSESDGVTTETVDMEVTVHIPLVGGKLEGLIADLLRKALDAEYAVGRHYLSR